jgi:glycosyltransferase involved in cell wall biosynthesis
MNEVVIYFGFNDLRSFKRGVENVILSQVASQKNAIKYYVSTGTNRSVYRWGDLTCITLKKNWSLYLCLNMLVLTLLKKHKSQRVLIHSHQYLFSFFCLQKTNLFTVHDGLYYLSEKFGASKLKLLVYALIEKVVYTRVPAIHFVSEFAKRNSLPFPISNKIFIIHNTTALEKKYGSISSIGIRDNEKLVLTVRSIEHRAGIDLVLNVALQMQRQNEKVVFFIAGKGPLLNLYKQQAVELGLKNTTFAGYVTDEELIGLYKNCSLVLIPSLYGEGFGLPIIEGYLFDKPVIASNACAIPEVIFSDEFLFENNVSSVLSKLEFGLRYQVKQSQFQQFYNMKYSSTVIGERYRYMYQEVFKMQNAMKI